MTKPSKFELYESLRGVQLTPAEYRVLVTLSTYANKDLTSARPSVATLMWATQLGEATIKRSLRALVDRGLLKRVQRGGGTRPAVFEIRPVPAGLAKPRPAYDGHRTSGAERDQFDPELSRDRDQIDPETYASDEAPEGETDHSRGGNGSFTTEKRINCDRDRDHPDPPTRVGPGLDQGRPVRTPLTSEGDTPALTDEAPPHASDAIKDFLSDVVSVPVPDEIDNPVERKPAAILASAPADLAIVEAEIVDTRPVSVSARRRSGKDTPEHRVAVAAYDRTNKALDYLKTRAVAKWAIHTRGEQPELVLDAIVGVHELGRPVMNATVGQWLDRHIGPNGQRSGPSKQDSKISSYLETGRELADRLAAQQAATPPPGVSRPDPFADLL